MSVLLMNFSEHRVSILIIGYIIGYLHLIKLNLTSSLGNHEKVDFKQLQHSQT